VATEDPEFNRYHQASEIPPHKLKMIRRFFQDYKQLEGKAVEVEDIQPAETAYPIIQAALAHYATTMENPSQPGDDYSNCRASFRAV